MNHEPSPAVQDGPARWVVECACGHEAVGEHPRSAEGKHEKHVGIETARAALRGKADDGA